MPCRAWPPGWRRRGAALLLTNEEGDNVPALVAQALEHPQLRAADNLIFLADLRAIPMSSAARTRWPARTPSSKWSR